MTSAQSLSRKTNSNFSFSRPRIKILTTVLPYAEVESVDESNIDNDGPKVLRFKLSATSLSIKFSVALVSTYFLRETRKKSYLREALPIVVPLLNT